MLGLSSTVLILIVVLAVFAWAGLTVGSDRDLDEFAVARNSQDAGGLGLSFFASGVGAWVLFAAPEVGATVGLAGVLGYAVAIVLPLAGLVLVGRRLRELVPSGHSLIEFVRVRFGRTMHVYTLGISLVYMLVALAAELTAVGAVLSLVSDVDPRVGIVAVAAGTVVYTAYGGLRASIRTDRWQSWLLLGLLVVVGVVVLWQLPAGSAGDSQAIWDVNLAGIEGALALVVAVMATTLFHNGYWQRVWAARDQRALKRGAVIGAVTRFPVVLGCGLVGLLAVAHGVSLGSPPVPFFAVLDRQSVWLLAVVLMLALALVASTVDTLQNGLAAVIVTARPALGLLGGRIATVVLTLIPTVVAFQGFSVLRLFLIADLFCAATLVPALLGLWRRATPTGAVAGAVSGLAGTLGYGYVAGGSLSTAVAVATFESGLALPPFLAALTGSSVVAIAVSLVGSRRQQTDALGRHIGPLSGAGVRSEAAAREPRETR